MYARKVRVKSDDSDDSTCNSLHRWTYRRRSSNKRNQINLRQCIGSSTFTSTTDVRFQRAKSRNNRWLKKYVPVRVALRRDIYKYISFRTDSLYLICGAPRSLDNIYMNEDIAISDNLLYVASPRLHEICQKNKTTKSRPEIAAHGIVNFNERE